MREDVDEPERVEVPDQVERRDRARSGRGWGSVTVRNRCQADAPSTAAASCRSSEIDCTPASRATVVCGMPAQTPTRITAGSAHEKSDSQSMFDPGRWAR